MLPLELIGVLGLLYVFFMIGTVKAYRAKSAVRRRAKVRTKRAVRGLRPQTAKPSVQA
jgi:hypothetical protein